MTTQADVYAELHKLGLLLHTLTGSSPYPQRATVEYEPGCGWTAWLHTDMATGHGEWEYVPLCVRVSKAECMRVLLAVRVALEQVIGTKGA